MAALIGDIARGAVESALREATNKTDAYTLVSKALHGMGLGVHEMSISWGEECHMADIVVTREVGTPFQLEVRVRANAHEVSRE